MSSDARWAKPIPVTRIPLTDEDRAALTAWSRSSAGEDRLVERARIVLLASEWLSAREIARRLNTRLARVSKWRQRFARQGMAGRQDAPRSGKPKTYTEATEERLLALLDSPSPQG